MKPVAYDNPPQANEYSHPRKLRQDEEMVTISVTVHDKTGAKKAMLGTNIGERINSGFTPFIDPSSGNQYYSMDADSYLTYTVDLRVQGAYYGSTILLGTPALDDISIFYSTGVRILFYSAVPV